MKPKYLVFGLLFSFSVWSMGSSGQVVTNPANDPAGPGQVISLKE